MLVWFPVLSIEVSGFCDCVTGGGGSGCRDFRRLLLGVVGSGRLASGSGYAGAGGIVSTGIVGIGDGKRAGAGGGGA